MQEFRKLILDHDEATIAKWFTTIMQLIRLNFYSPKVKNEEYKNRLEPSMRYYETRMKEAAKMERVYHVVYLTVMWDDSYPFQATIPDAKKFWETLFRKDIDDVEFEALESFRQRAFLVCMNLAFRDPTVNVYECVHLWKLELLKTNCASKSKTDGSPE